MTCKSGLKYWLNTVVLGLFLASSLYLPVAQAAMIDTRNVAAPAPAEAQREKLNTLLARADVKQQLIQWGVDPAVAQSRINALSDAELAELAEQIDSLPAGAGALGTLVFIFLVLLVTDILGYTDIFPFVRSSGR